MNDGSTDLRKFKNIKHFSRTAMKIFRAEQQYSIRYRVLERATNWKPNNTGRVRCNRQQQASMASLVFELHYLFDFRVAHTVV